VSASVSPVPWSAPHRIEHVVLIIKENRTYDTIFGDLAGGDGLLAGLEPCPDEGEELAHGRKLALGDKSRHRRCRHAPEATPFYHALARAFTLSDRFFSEVRGPSFPNHQILVSGDFTELDDPGSVKTWRCPEHCYDRVTFPEHLAKHGRSWRAYAKEAFVPAFRMYRRLADSKEIVSWHSLETDAARGALPNVSWVYCEFADSEHPPASLCRGERWTRRLIESLVASPQWPRMAVFVLWDDWGGLWDHVDPPVVERDSAGDPVRWGHRVPLLVVSPWAKRGHVSHAPASFLSVLRWTFETLGVPLPDGRIRGASSLGDCFDFSQGPPSKLVLPAPAECAKKAR